MADIHLSANEIDEILTSLCDQGNGFDFQRWLPVIRASFQSMHDLLALLSTRGATIRQVRNLYGVEPPLPDQDVDRDKPKGGQNGDASGKEDHPEDPATKGDETDQTQSDKDEDPSTDTNADDENELGDSPESGSDSNPKPNPNHSGKAGAQDYLNAKKCIHRHSDLQAKSICPDCKRGRLYEKQRSRLILIGSSPLTPEHHVFIDLVCNLCQRVFKAPASEEAKEEGVEEERLYGHSAVAMLTVLKFFSQIPYYRSEGLTRLLGVKIPTSSQFDQVEKMCDTLGPVLNLMVAMAMSWRLYMADDATAKVLDTTIEEKPIRGTDKVAQRYGCHSSVVLAFDKHDRMMVLIKSGIIHAGEWMDELLEGRNKALAPPILMWDRCSSNNVTVTDYIDTACNQHARAKFIEHRDSYPQAIDPILEKFKRLFFNDTQTVNMGPAERLRYHQKHSAPVFESILTRCKETIAKKTFTPNSDTAKPFQYMLDHAPQLRGFLEHEGVPLSNNLTERVIKNLVLIRRTSHYYRTKVSAAIADAILSVGLTAIYCGVNVFEYLRMARANKKEVREKPEDWLPWRFLERYPEYKIQEKSRSGSWPFDPSKPYIPLQPPR